MNDQTGHDDYSLAEKAQRISYLISAYLRKSITPEEHDELDEWVGANDENMRIFEELTDEDKMKKALDFIQEADAEKSLNKVKSQLVFAKYYSPRPLFSRGWHYAAAACLLLVAGFAWFAFNKKDKDKQDEIVVIQPQDLKPGSIDKAILTLEDGSTIILDQARDGKLASQGSSEVTKQNGQLNYSAANGTQNAVLYNTVTTPRGGSYPLTLSDGTKIWLNASSSIRFPAVFNENERRVAITGEVYFEVASIKGQSGKVPFIVDVKDKGTSVEVLGTHFNINSYNDEAILKTTLLEGAVKVVKDGKASLLKPGQQAQVSNSGDIKTVSNIDVDYVMAWKNGLFRFSNTDLKSIMNQVSRWYDVDIEYQTTANPGYTGLLRRDFPASKIISVLEESGGAHFKIEGKKIIVLP
jgi:ferric-dicitrate binding protein FerR (iron transport regulator)